METVFHIPLDQKQLADLGRLSAVWSQMDYMLLLAISKLVNVRPIDCEILLDKSSAGPRIAIFGKLTKTLANSEAKEIATDFVSQIDPVLGKRNHLTHGIWGLFSGEANKDYEPACYHPQNKRGLIYASELERVANEATVVTNLIGRFISLDHGPKFQNSIDRKLYMGYGPPEGRYTASEGSMYMDLGSLGHSPK